MSNSPEAATPLSADAAATTQPSTAGGLLRQARQAQGLHIAALAAAIKVVPRKLELLESDQFDQLTDATFTRALAQAVCRTLKVDAAPILALLPPPSGENRLEHIAKGLNTPFRERPGRLVPQEWAKVTSPALWLAALLVIGAAAIYLLPAGWLPLPNLGALRTTASAPGVAPAMTEAASSAAAPVEAASAPLDASVPLPTLSSPPAAAEVATTESAPVAGILQLHVTAASWIEITDAHGQALIARVLQPGESVGLDGVTPLKARIGNAAGTQLVFRGQPLELAPFTRDNVARLELK